MKSTLEKITPEPATVKKLPFPKLVIYRDHGVIVLMTKEHCGILLKADGLRNDMFEKTTGWLDDKDWEDLAPDECVKLTNQMHNNMHGFISTTPTKEYGYIDGKIIISPDDLDWELMDKSEKYWCALSTTQDGTTWVNRCYCRRDIKTIGDLVTFHPEILAIRRPKQKKPLEMPVPPVMEKVEQWVSVKERLPDAGKHFFTYDNKKVRFITGDGGTSASSVTKWFGYFREITHWMYAPEFPAPPAHEKEPWEVGLGKLREEFSEDSKSLYSLNENLWLFRQAFQLGRESKGDK